MTIEERAKQKYPIFTDVELEEELNRTLRERYIETCYEQREIDIRQMIEWLKANAERYIFNTSPKYGTYGDILTCIDNKMYDDLVQAMKG